MVPEGPGAKPNPYGFYLSTKVNKKLLPAKIKVRTSGMLIRTICYFSIKFFYRYAAAQ